MVKHIVKFILHTTNGYSMQYG